MKGAERYKEKLDESREWEQGLPVEKDTHQPTHTRTIMYKEAQE